MNFKAIIDEIESDENKRRKAEHQKRFHIYNDHQRGYVLELLTNEFSAQTVRDMRTCTSINLSRPIIQQMASLYKRSPERTFTDVSQDQHEAIEFIYQACQVNVALKKANQKFKLHNQCVIQVIPKDGKIALKVLGPHQYDVVPDPRDPEVAQAYIISTFDKGIVESANTGTQDIQGNQYGGKNQNKSNGVNEAIADEDDYLAATKRYIVWTAAENMLIDGNGRVIEVTANPIGKLPFIDVANERDFEYWVRRGSGVCEFALDFLTTLSDNVNTNRLQSYSQPVITAEKIPESVTVGPNHILFLPLDPSRPDMKPSFEFANPNPDLKASLDLMDRLVSYFLTAQGIDPKTIASNSEGNKFTSGLERLLSMIEKFEASQDDIDLFVTVEEKLYQLIKDWYTVTAGTDMLSDKLNFGAWPESSELSVSFSGPEMVRTEAEKEDSVIKLLEAGLINKTEAIMELRHVDKDKAEEIAKALE